MIMIMRHSLINSQIVLKIPLISFFIYSILSINTYNKINTKINIRGQIGIYFSMNCPIAFKAIYILYLTENLISVYLNKSG